MNKESMIDYLGELKKEYKITGSCDTELFCERLGLSVDELVGLLMGLFIIKSNDVVKCRDAYLQLERRNETLEEIIDARYENKNKKQTTLVKHGLPIAKKNRQSDGNEIMYEIW